MFTLVIKDRHHYSPNLLIDDEVIDSPPSLYTRSPRMNEKVTWHFTCLKMNNVLWSPKIEGKKVKYVVSTLNKGDDLREIKSTTSKKTLIIMWNLFGCWVSIFHQFGLYTQSQSLCIDKTHWFNCNHGRKALSSLQVLSSVHDACRVCNLRWCPNSFLPCICSWLMPKDFKPQN